MSEPRDNRPNLPWVAQGGHIWTEPPIPNAAPLAVTSEALTPPQMADYIVGLHNAALRAATVTDDVRDKGTAYANENYPGEPIELKGIVQSTYIEAFNEGWAASAADVEQTIRDIAEQNASLKAQVDAGYQRAEGLASANAALNERNAELAAALRTVTKDRDTYRLDLGSNVQRAGLLQSRVNQLSDQLQDAETELSDLRDDARIAASLSSSPGAREAAMERIRRRSPAVQDQLEQFGRDVEANPLGEAPTLGQRAPFGDLSDYPPSDKAAQEPGPITSYDKGKPLAGIGHHSPSYAEGYRIGREDTQQALREPIESSGQALYAAHLLLAESVAAHEGTRTQWQKAVRRWQDEYVRVFGDEDQA